MKPYSIVVPCDCCNPKNQGYRYWGEYKQRVPKGYILNHEGNRHPCPYCSVLGSNQRGTGNRKKYVPHPSHRMTKWRTEILSPNGGEPRFYGVRECLSCGEEEWEHAAGHFLHSLGQPCDVKRRQR